MVSKSLLFSPCFVVCCYLKPSCAAATTNPNIKYNTLGKSMVLIFNTRSNSTPKYGPNFFLLADAIINEKQVKKKHSTILPHSVTDVSQRIHSTLLLHSVTSASVYTGHYCPTEWRQPAYTLDTIAPQRDVSQHIHSTLLPHSVTDVSQRIHSTLLPESVTSASVHRL